METKNLSCWQVVSRKGDKSGGGSVLFEPIGQKIELAD